MDTTPAVLVLVLALAALPPADADPCAAQRPDGSTASKLPGTWLFVAAAAQYPPHRAHLRRIDHAYLRLDPGATEQELLIKHYVAMGDRCYTDNRTYLEVTPGESSLVKNDETQQIEGRLMNMSSENVLLIQYEMKKIRTYLGQYLYARSLPISPAERKEFEQHVKCLRLRRNQIVYAPWKTDVCQVEEAEDSPEPGTAAPA